MKLSVLLSAVLLVVACESATTINGSWSKPGTSKAITSVLVVGLAQSEARRRAFEDTFAKALEDAGLKAVASHTRVALEDLNRDSIVAATRGGTLEGVLVVSLLGVDEQERAVPAQSSTSVGTSHGTLGGYYQHAQGTYYAPGYVDRYRIVNAETNLYESSSEKLIWTGVSESFERSGMEYVRREYSQAMARELVRDGVIRRP